MEVEVWELIERNRPLLELDVVPNPGDQEARNSKETKKQDTKYEYKNAMIN